MIIQGLGFRVFIPKRALFWGGFPGVIAGDTRSLDCSSNGSKYPSSVECEFYSKDSKYILLIGSPKPR